MNFVITYTDSDKHKVYPMHKHPNHEIIYYLEGTGELMTSSERIKVCRGNIAIMPPDTLHALTNPHSCKWIAINGNFERNLYFSVPTLLNDNAENDGRKLSDMIYRNCTSENEYLASLINAYAYFIMRNIHFGKNIDMAISEIKHTISTGFSECDMNIKTILESSGYAEDYIRSIFKKNVGVTPNEYLTDVRMKHACYLTDVYGDSMNLSEIALRCGYYDYTYFSQKFKKVFGMSPREYKNTVKSL